MKLAVSRKVAKKSTNKSRTAEEPAAGEQRIFIRPRGVDMIGVQ
jgi:hypothetical protein